MSKFHNYLRTLSDIKIDKNEDYKCIFHYNNLIFIFDSFENDPYYFRLSLPNVFQINDNNKNWVYDEINTINIKIKVAKLIDINNNIWCVADEFVYSFGNIDSLFQRTIACLHTIYEELKKDYISYNKNDG